MKVVSRTAFVAGSALCATAPSLELLVTYRVLQGLGAELGFAIGLYRWWGLPAAALAGALAGVAAAVHDVIVYYPDLGVGYWIVYAVAAVASGAILAGAGAWLLLRALVATGVLADFAVGRQQREV